MGRPRTYDDDLRRRLLLRAGQIVSEGGTSALSLRGLADDEGTSTSAVYTLFGGKDELWGALYEEAFTRFGESQKAVPASDDAVSDILALTLSYRDWALDNPHLYDIMFGGSLASFVPTEEQGELAISTKRPLREMVKKAVKAGQLHGDVRLITHALWATLHGVTSLAINMGPRYRGLEYHEAAMHAVLDGFKKPALAKATPKANRSR